MLVLWSLLAIVLSLLLVVGPHEVGHAYVAHLFRVGISRISFGFGRPLFRWDGKKGCQWVWSLWPLGGYVHFLNTRTQVVLEKDLPYCFDKKSVGARCLILLAGPLLNCTMAWLALVFMLILGYQQQLPVIDTITPSSLASSAGLVKGDRIISLSGAPVSSWRVFGMQFIMALGHDNVDGVVETSEGNQHHFRLDLKHPALGKGSLFKAIGIQPDSSIKHLQAVQGLPFLKACQGAFFQLMGLAYFFLVMLKQLLTGVIPLSMLLGPLGLLNAMAHSFSQGFAVFLDFIANLSLSVGLFNLLPIPGLDGGGIVYAVIEKIRGKPFSVAFELLVQSLMFIALCLLLVQLLMGDVQRYLSLS